MNTFKHQREAQDRIDNARYRDRYEPGDDIPLGYCPLVECLMSRDSQQVKDPRECHLCREGVEPKRESHPRKEANV